ncbi:MULTISPECIES: cytochrome c maturation protein CcmE [unclassified Bartonella]|uniref:cytochrome c maturation protein CcmE n=1 Tax=unclassified Bartonella TaxID=2645622 RepID=UPI000998E8DF|nr:MULTISPECIES: cytochrome c maturation protein CcmE [unclassified Bartonella]AQX27660.1 cytochrome c-type biogenesis protein CcmE [Bartonella sp. JB15]AQX28941.1 cytochrome c-type biogenesis protein CcmE [Bartonella sp. JB63]
MNSPPLNDFSSLELVLKKRKKNRLLMILLCLFVIAVATGLVLYAIRDTVNFFRMPSEITREDILTGRPLRLGGFVEKGTVEYSGNMQVSFFVTDSIKHKKVVFTGILPDLFREGQGVIVEGYFNKQRLFIGTRILAKHDETYMSKEMADRMNKCQNMKRQFDCAS